MWLFLSIILVAIQLQSWSIAAAASAPCEVTLIKAGVCNHTGSAQVPDVISTSKTSSAVDCGGQCLSTENCKSIRYVEEPQACYMYGKYISSMSFDYYEYDDGYFYNRDCFTTNCKQIQACQATLSCGFTYLYYGYNVYEQFACSYGHTARQWPKEYLYMTFPGKYSACRAARECSGHNDYGAFDLHYHIASGQWLCYWYNVKHLNPDYPTLAAERAGPNRYTHRNSSIGAGYGFWFEQQGLGPGRKKLA